MQSPVATVLLTGPAFIISLANQKALELWDRTREEVINKPIFESFPELQSQGFQDILNRVYCEGETYRSNHIPIRLRRHGKLADAYINFVYEPFRDEQGRITGIIGIGTDMTPEVEARKKLEELEQRSRLAIEAAEMGTFDWDIRNHSFLSSQRLLDIFGFAGKPDTTHQQLLDVMHEDDRKIRNKLLQNAYGLGSLSYEARVIWPDNSIHWIKVYGKMLFDEANDPLRMYGTVMDITEYKNTVGALEESEERLRIAIDAADLGSYDLNIITNEISFSKRLAEMYGWTNVDELSHSALQMVVHPEDRHIMERANRDALKTGVLDYESRLLWKDNSIHWVRAKGKVIFNEQHVPVRMLGTVMDITEEKNAQHELEESESRLRLATESAELGTFDFSITGNEVLYSPRYLQIFGYNETREWTKKEFLEHVHPDDQHLVAEAREKAILTGQLNYEVRIIWKDSSIHWIKKNGKVVYAENGQAIRILGTLMDITDQKKSRGELERKIEERTIELKTKNLQLQQQKDFVDIILDSSVDNIAVFDKELRYLTVNRKFEEMYQRSKDQLIGRKLSEVFPMMIGSDFEKVLNKSFATNSVQNWKHVSLITHKFYDTFFIPLHYNGQLNAVLAIAHDNTEIINASEKIKKVNNDLLEKNRELEWTNNELEQFAYIASHDLQEPLRKIRTYSGILHENLKLVIDQNSNDTLQKIMNSAERMSNLIYDLLNFSRLLNPEKTFEDTDLIKVVKNVINDFELTIEQKKAVIDVQGLPQIKSAPLQMNQLFYNLLNNSLKFSRENIPPVITIKCRTLSPEEVKERKNLKKGIPYYDITVADNGIGFDPQYSEHIFEVFKRLQNKAAYPGSGIGLALCRKIALNHHGDIYGEGKEGAGSMFHVLLPAKYPENSNSPKNQ